MARAKITKKNGYICAPSGAKTQVFQFGEIVSGQVAEWALADNAAQRMFDPRSDVQAIEDIETKGQPKRRGRKGKGDSK